MNKEQLARELASCREQQQFLLSAVRSLLYLLKEFAIETEELDTKPLKKCVDILAGFFTPERVNGISQSAFDHEKEFILTHFERQKEHIRKREDDLKSIIEFMRSSMLDVVGDSQDFRNRIYESNTRMERLSSLNDILRIKDGLKSEVNLIKRVVREKQVKDTERINKLSKEIGALKSSLEEAKEASMTDALTGARNRLSFDSYLQSCLERNAISPKPFSILMCDLDNFRKINEEFGHLVGDGVLKAFVRECKAVCHSDDFVARFGGEEFIIVLPGASLRMAIKVAGRLKAKIAAANYYVDTANDRKPVRFTVSIGVSEGRRDDTPESLVERADKALYCAKRAGKDCTRSERDVTESARPQHMAA